MKTIFFTAALFLLSTQTHAKLFSNSYVSFELPPRWECESDETEWFCRSGTAADQKEAVIIITAKKAGPKDNLAYYQSVLRNPKSGVDPRGNPITSTVLSMKQQRINDHNWVDGFHISSEIKDYYTRYLGTTKDGLAILVTFTAHKLNYTKYSSDFFAGIQSLRVTTSPDKMMGSALAGQAGGGESLGSPLGATFPTEMLLDENTYPEESNLKSDYKEKALGLGLLLVAIGAYIFLKRRKK